MLPNEKAVDYKYIPLRLSEDERRLLSVLENALEVTSYTDSVDVVFSHTKKTKLSRIMEGLVDILSIACGLLTSNDLLKGEALIVDRKLEDNIPLFRDLFEIGRRYKMMNPSKMRETYGKLMYILMDTEMDMVKRQCDLNFIKPIQTVYSFCIEKESIDILDDPLLVVASTSISNDDNSTQQDIIIETHNKEKALHEIKRKYVSDSLTDNDVQRIVDSVADNQSYLTYNALPVERMINILKESFNPKQIEDPFSLQLTTRVRKVFNSITAFGGYSSSYSGGGACLSHDHPTQYTFVLQSLTLWKEIMSRMPKLWMLADLDMTRESYRLVDTGQGYQRLQACPNVAKEMSRILNYVQSKCGS